MRQKIFSKVTRRLVFASIASVMVMTFAQQAAAQKTIGYPYHSRGYTNFWECVWDSWHYKHATACYEVGAYVYGGQRVPYYAFDYRP